MSGVLRVAIVHYHLRPGGVTRVIERAVRAVASRGVRCCVLVGEGPAEGAEGVAGVRVVDGLGYAGAEGAGGGDRLADRIEDAAVAGLGDRPDAWHFHNHSLGKNPGLAAAAARLAARGERLLLQIHDFAEDGRPRGYRALLDSVGGDAAMLTGMLYPQAGHVHYALINGRDRNLLCEAGVEPRRLHLLDNPVALEEGADAAGPAPCGGEGRLFLYPSRAIRRKNVGEFLLWAAAGRPGDRFAITMAPLNPEERPVYEGWVRFARDRGLPVEFEAGGAARPLAGLLREACAAVTTSVGEGFGLAFLEPAIAGRAVVGRNLPEVTAGLAECGIDLSGLYDRLEIPISWIGAARVGAAIGEGLRRARAKFGRGTTEDDIECAVAAAVRGTRVDFGRLDEPLQRAVIERLVEDPSVRGEIQPAAIDPPGEWEGAVRKNREAIRRVFGEAAYGARLKTVYDAVAGCEATAVSSLEPDAVLDRFLGPERFVLLMT